MSNFFKKGIITVLVILILLPAAALLTGATHSKGASLPWTTNYSQALERSKAEGKPVLLFFTGSDWCSWCTRLENEVFHTDSFIEKAKDKFIFVELDFPQQKSLPADLKAQNKKLQEQFSIKGYPTVVVVDSEGKKVGQTGYEAGGGQTYLAILDKMVAPHQARFAKNQAVAVTVKTTPEKIAQIAVSEAQVEMELIAFKGMSQLSREKALKDELAKSNPNPNLLRAAYLIQPGANDLKGKLLALDTDHKQGNAYFVALSDYVREGEAIKHLVAFAENVGESDKVNLWKAEWTVAKGHLKAGNDSEAIKWAEKSIAHAPDPSKSEVQTWVTSFRKAPEQEKVAVEANLQGI